MAKSHLNLVMPPIKKRTVKLIRPPNADVRTREYLTETEVERLMNAAKNNRHGHRDATMILVAYRHGLRASELVDLRWDQVDFRTATLHVRRVKQGTPSTHPIIGDELRALRRLQREQRPKSPFVFTSERGAPFATAGFARMIERAGVEAQFGFKAHPHMLRHLAATRWPTEVTTLGRFRHTSDTKTFSTQFDILNYRRLGSKTFGGKEPLDILPIQLIHEANIERSADRRTSDRNIARGGCGDERAGSIIF
jgi:type 1 fimbriae regulatory protein FimB/type 1 fimbriae regulatory protein FimE